MSHFDLDVTLHARVRVFDGPETLDPEMVRFELHKYLTEWKSGRYLMDREQIDRALAAATENAVCDAAIGAGLAECVHELGAGVHSLRVVSVERAPDPPSGDPA